LAESDKATVKVSIVSRPFIVSAVVLVFAGSIIGSMWMMSLFGTGLPFARGGFALHKVFQVEGFLTLLVMGIGYMIVPRFRNVQLPSTKMAYFSLLLVLFSIAASIVSVAGTDMAAVGAVARFSGIAVFAGIILWTIRIRPRLLRTADYFIALSVITMVATSLLQAAGLDDTGNVLSQVEILLLFPILMIFGVEYKTLPSFLGFIRPRRRLSWVSFVLAAASVALGIASMLHGHQLLATAFNVSLLGSTIAFAGTTYIFGGFDNSEILRLIQGEKKARYRYTIRHSRLAFSFLFAGIAMAAGFSATSLYILYDLAIHYIAIGFIGITIALYLPLMLPPITGRMLHFTKFNNIPVILVVAALLMRAAGDAFLSSDVPLDTISFLMFSGWLIVAALFVFVAMIHRSMSIASNS
jgi:hypothetical protein